MDGNTTKRYESYKLPENKRRSDDKADKPLLNKKTDNLSLIETVRFAEIEIDDNKNSVNAKAAPKPQIIKAVVDERRMVFNKMRQIAWENQSPRFDNSIIFYRQAVFMKDFEDDYTERVSFEAQCPYYQLMNYEQLRTYFTWRTDVRSGNVTNASVSYAFIYIYELLNNIGVKNPQEGLNNLMSFWKAFREYDSSIDKYMYMWIKDYHVYYELTKPFKEFVVENNIHTHYPSVFGLEPDSDDFEKLCGVSKYEIMKSVFYNNERHDLIKDCFNFIIKRFRNLTAAAKINFDSLVFMPVEDDYIWKPFNGALFFTPHNQPDKIVVLSEKEIYKRRCNIWSSRSVITLDSGRQLIGYIMKRMESELRRITRFKHKISANINTIDSMLIKRLNAAGIMPESIIVEAVSDFYKEKNRKVISINIEGLDKIRTDAFDIQEKLSVQENEEFLPIENTKNEHPTDEIKLEEQEADEWVEFKNSLSETEFNALAVILKNGNIKQFCDANSIMIEVLADSINQKAYDTVNDNILELCGDITVYEDYIEKLEEVLNI